MKNIYDIIRKVDENRMVVYKSKKYGFIWAGKAKFMFNCFRHEAFEQIPEEVSTDSTGALVITVAVA